MTTTTGSEVPFLSGMERKEESVETVTVTAAATLAERVKDLFRADGRLAHMIGAMENLLEKARAMANERGPRDYDEERDRELKDMLFEAVRFGASQGGKGHGVINGNGKVVATLLAINIALTGAVSTWIVNTITKQGEAIIEQGRDIAVIKCQIDPKCRLVVSSDKP